MTRPFVASEIAGRLGGRLEGEPGIEVDGVGDLDLATAREVAVVFDPQYEARARASAAAVIVAPEGMDLGARTVIRVAEPRGALVELIDLLHPPERRPPGIRSGATIAASATLGERVHVASGACVEENARLGDDVEIHENAVVGRGAVIGAGSVIHPQVVIYPRTRIGERVEIHAGTVIGGPGFGFLRQSDGSQRRIPQIGWVEIEDDVEIGALCAIDRATLGATRVRRGTKIDNLVQIGHNSVIGEDCCLAAQVGISGSVQVGAGSLLLGQVGVADHAVLAAGTTVAAQSGVLGHLEAGEWLGYPALPMPRARRVYGGLIARLPELYREVRRLRRELAERSGDSSSLPGPNGASPEHLPGTPNGGARE